MGYRQPGSTRFWSRRCGRRPRTNPSAAERRYLEGSADAPPWVPGLAATPGETAPAWVSGDWIEPVALELGEGPPWVPGPAVAPGAPAPMAPCVLGSTLEPLAGPDVVPGCPGAVPLLRHCGRSNNQKGARGRSCQILPDLHGASPHSAKLRRKRTLLLPARRATDQRPRLRSRSGTSARGFPSESPLRLQPTELMRSALERRYA